MALSNKPIVIAIKHPHKASLVAICLLYVMVVFSARATPTGAQIVQQIGTVFVIAMENHNFTQPDPNSGPQQLLGNSAAPYFNSLITPGHPNAAQVSYATKYYNAGIGVHPSEPDYIWTEAGTDFGVHTDDDPNPGSGNVFNVPHLTAQLNAAGIAWRNYQEDVQLSSSPTNSVSGPFGPVNAYNGSTQFDYAVKHNPMAFFTDTATQNVYALTNLAADLTHISLGRYNWITPDEYNDAHTGLANGFTYRGVHYTDDQAAVAQGDNFLSIIVPQIMASSAYKNNGAIIILWDETEEGDSTNYTLPALVISPLAKGNAYASSVVLSHSSGIKTIEEMLGLNFLSNAIPADETAPAGGYNNVASVNDLSDMFKPPPVLSGYGTFTTNGFQFSFSAAIGQSYRVLASGDVTRPLTNWTVLTFGTVVTNPTICTDMGATTNAQRFYRIASP